MKLDHIMFAANDLEKGMAQIGELTGVAPEWGGSHAGTGTRNALLSFGNEQYLEIIAPDPDQDVGGAVSEELSSLDESYIRTWAAATEDFGALIPVLEQFGFGHHIVDMSRTRPDGVLLAWQMLFVTGQPHGLAMPFFINWMDSEHPALVAPGGCSLRSFSVQCPDAESFEAFCRAINLEIDIANGDLLLSADIQTAAGTVVLA